MILKNVEEETLIHHSHLHKAFKLVKKKVSLRKRVTPTVVTLSEHDILKIAKTVKSFLIEDIKKIVEKKPEINLK